MLVQQRLGWHPAQDLYLITDVSSRKACEIESNVPRLEGRLLCLLRPLPQLAASIPSPSPSFSSTTSFATSLPLALLTSPGSGNVLDNDPLLKRLTPLVPLLLLLVDVPAADDGTPWKTDEAAGLAEIDADGWWRGLETVFARRNESVSGAGGPVAGTVPEVPDEGGEAPCENEFVEGPRGWRMGATGAWDMEDGEYGGRADNMQEQGRYKYSDRRMGSEKCGGGAVPTDVYFRTRYSSSCILGYISGQCRCN